MLRVKQTAKLIVKMYPIRVAIHKQLINMSQFFLASQKHTSQPV